MKTSALLSGFALLITGLVAIFHPDLVYSAIVEVAIAAGVINGFYQIGVGTRTSSRSRILRGILSLAFGVVLAFFQTLPEWLIRVSFGTYSLVLAGSLAIQLIIYYVNGDRSSVSTWILCFAYLILGGLLLFTPSVSTHRLIQFFGCYFILLSLRFFGDALDFKNKKYQWKRAIHISLPMPLLAIIPDWTLQQINHHIQKGKDVEIYSQKELDEDRRPTLKALVHVGPEGFQKVGHFSFVYKDVVYSYGNYDKESERLFGTVGDGVFFTVPYELYLGNITRYEKNTIFEYDIELTRDQERQVENQLEQLKNSSYRWYSPIERSAVPSQLDELETDYPSRLHYRTGAKFYKIKKGKFRTYWAMGENCVLFADRILGAVGADVLSVRGIITPGTYFDYLQSEFEKENSPVVARIVHRSQQSVQSESDAEEIQTGSSIRIRKHHARKIRSHSTPPQSLNIKK